MRRYGKTIGLLCVIVMIAGCDTTMVVTECPTQEQGVADGEQIFAALSGDIVLTDLVGAGPIQLLSVLNQAGGAADDIRLAPKGQCDAYDQGIDDGFTSALQAAIVATVLGGAG